MPRPPGSRPLLGTRAWRAYASCAAGGVLTGRRLGCAVLVVLIVVAVAALALPDRAADGVVALFVDEPDMVTGRQPVRHRGTERSGGSGSEAIDRIVARDRLIVACSRSRA